MFSGNTGSGWVTKMNETRFGDRQPAPHRHRFRRSRCPASADQPRARNAKNRNAVGVSDRNRFTNQRTSLAHPPSRTTIRRWRHGSQTGFLSPLRDGVQQPMGATPVDTGRVFSLLATLNMLEYCCSSLHKPAFDPGQFLPHSASRLSGGKLCSRSISARPHGIAMA